MIAAALIDTHCHFDFAPFCGDEAASLHRARAAGIGDIIVPSIEASRFASVLALAHRYPMLHAALGLHPLYIEHHRDTDIAALDTLLAQADPAVVALGEIGLDHYGDVRQPARQLSLLQDQLALAQRYDLPVILHSRRSHDLLAKILRQRRLMRTGVVHGFPAAWLRRRPSCVWGMRLASAARLPTHGRTRPVPRWRRCRWRRCCWRPMRRICRCSVTRRAQSSGAADAGLCGPVCAAQ